MLKVSYTAASCASRLSKDNWLKNAEIFAWGDCLVSFRSSINVCLNWVFFIIFFYRYGRSFICRLIVSVCVCMSVCVVCVCLHHPLHTTRRFQSFQ